MSFDFAILPYQLRKVIVSAGRQYGESLREKLHVDYFNGMRVVVIDFAFSVNYRMFDLARSEAISAHKLERLNNPLYKSLIDKICVHLFGDNVSRYQKVFTDPKQGGTWSICVHNLEFKDEWLYAHVYLEPNGIFFGDS